MQDPREAAEVIGRTAQLTFHPVLGIEEPRPRHRQRVPVAQRVTAVSASPSPSPSPSASGEDGELAAARRGAASRSGSGKAALTGEGVEGAQGPIDSQGGGGWFVTIDFRGNGGDVWADLTGAAACAAAG